MEGGEDEHMDEQMKHQGMGQVKKSMEQWKVRDRIEKVREKPNKQAGNGSAVDEEKHTNTLYPLPHPTPGVCGIRS